MRHPTVVPFHDLSAILTPGDTQAAVDVAEAGWYVLGPQVQGFEHEWSERCGVASCIGTGNGLDAIEIGLRAAGIGPGDEVVTTSISAAATVLAILRAGARPVIADIDPTTGLLSRESVERSITSRTRAVLLVHLYGQMRGMADWTTLCGEHGLLLLEDCAQSHDAAVSGRRAGSWGAFGAFSFYPTKNLGALGDAGALVTSDKRLADRARALRNYGQTERYVHDMQGLNSRLDELQAAILTARLSRLADWTQRRREIALRYRSEIASSAVGLLSPPDDEENHVYHLFVVKSPQRDALRAHLAGLGVETLIHYPVPLGLDKALRDVPRDPAGIPAAIAHAEECLSLPCAPHLSDDEVSIVIDAVNSFTS